MKLARRSLSASSSSSSLSSAPSPSCSTSLSSLSSSSPSSSASPSSALFYPPSIPACPHTSTSNSSVQQPPRPPPSLNTSSSLPHVPVSPFNSVSIVSTQVPLSDKQSEEKISSKRPTKDLLPHQLPGEDDDPSSDYQPTPPDGTPSIGDQSHLGETSEKNEESQEQTQNTH